MTANILWMGGEDIDFPNGTIPTAIGSSNSTYMRTTYVRCAIDCRTDCARSLSFVGGAVTSAWITARLGLIAGSTAVKSFGLGKNSAGNKFVGVGTDASSGTKLAIFKFDGTTRTQITNESGTSLSTGGGGHHVDLQVSGNTGLTSCTLTAYVDGIQVATTTGYDLSALFASLDCAVLGSDGGGAIYVSEIIVADGDTRSMGLLTMGPNAAGDTNNWTNAYTNINPTQYNDSNVVYVNTTAQDFQANLINLPTGAFSVLAVKAAVRAEVTAGSTPTLLKIGVKSGGTVSVDSGQSPTSSFTTYERLMATNPVTSVAFQSSDMNALQMDLQSG